MNNPITIRVSDFTGGPIAVAAADGQQLHDAVAPLLKEGKPVVLSFAGIETIIAAFLSAAVGQLYGEFSKERIRELIAIRDLSPDDELQLGRVVRNACAYFKNPELYDQAWKEGVGDEV